MCIFIDIHTHKNATVAPSIWSLKNILLHKQQAPFDIPISVGWHPWFINNVSLTEIKTRLILVAKQKNVFAIGECGLDRTIKTPIEVQLKVFKLHLTIASQNRKPIIMHCVKAYSDLMEVLTKNKLTIPIILHGFNGNQQQVFQLSKNNIYFSFGESLFKNNQKNPDTIRSIPLNRLFLETDESALSIEKIYLRAAEILKTSPDVIKRQLYINYTNLFGDGLVKQD